jgi:hypothetical protein
MRRRLTWLLVTLGIAALVRRLRRRSEPEAEAHEVDDPADELRRKLADSRSEEDDVAPPEPPPAVTVEERRADVHQEGRAALDEMRDSEA